jgi:ketosteroid isomerase-like protein
MGAAPAIKAATSAQVRHSALAKAVMACKPSARSFWISKCGDAHRCRGGLPQVITEQAARPQASLAARTVGRDRGSWPPEIYTERRGQQEGLMTTSERLSAVLERYKVAMGALRHGDAVPYADCWARTDEVTMYGPWGPVDKGWKTIADTLELVGSRLTGGTGKVELTEIVESGDLAYTVGFERERVSVDDGPVRERVLRVTQIYRRIDGQWRVVHRHADVLPEDQRKTRW